MTEGYEPLTQDLAGAAYAAKEQVLFPSGTLAAPRKMASGEAFLFKPRRRSERLLMNGAPVQRGPKANSAGPESQSRRHCRAPFAYRG